MNTLSLLKDARTRLKLSLYDVVKQLTELGRPCSPQLVFYWETGERRPFPEDIRALASIYGLPQATTAELIQQVEAARESGRGRRRGKRIAVEAA